MSGEEIANNQVGFVPINEELEEAEVMSQKSDKLIVEEKVPLEI